MPCPAGAQGALPLPPPPGAAGSAMAEPRGAPVEFGCPAPLPQTGWERLSELWRRDEQQQYPEETLNIAKSAFTAGVVGWLYGGLPAFISARKAFIESSRGEIFQSRADAVQSAHRAGIRSFIRYGWRWSWRVAAFATVFNVVSTGLAAYRDKTTISNFAAAGAFTGALFRMHLGLQGLVGGIMFGTAFGVPAGGLLMAMYGLAGETLQEKRSRERRELYEQRLAEWQSRLSMTEILGQTENNAQGRPEMERVTELKSY